MPKYMFQASYTTEGLKGLFRDGGSRRKADVEKAITGLGGSLEAIYYAFGQDDVFCIIDMPDNVSTASLALVIAASGAVNVKTVVLLTPEEIDQATKMSVDYRPPGQ
jgi:uncharacterized protein with GYD domain